jgi:hypothetical protein
MDAQSFLDCTGDYHNRVWTLRANTDEIVKAKAERFAADMVTQFIHKVGTKLSGIVEKKNGTHKVSITGGTLATTGWPSRSRTARPSMCRAR